MLQGLQALPPASLHPIRENSQWYECESDYSSESDSERAQLIESIEQNY